MSADQVRETAAKICTAGVGLSSKEVMLALSIATASIIKASFTPELHGAVLGAFNENVKHALTQMHSKSKPGLNS